MASAHIDLKGGQYQARHTQCRVSLLAHFDKTVFVNLFPYMDVEASLIANRGLAFRLSPVWHVIMTDKQADIIRQC